MFSHHELGKLRLKSSQQLLHHQQMEDLASEPRTVTQDTDWTVLQGKTNTVMRRKTKTSTDI